MPRAHDESIVLAGCDISDDKKVQAWFLIRVKKWNMLLSLFHFIISAYHCYFATYLYSSTPTTLTQRTKITSTTRTKYQPHHATTPRYLYQFLLNPAWLPHASAATAPAFHLIFIIHCRLKESISCPYSGWCSTQHDARLLFCRLIR
jgi:hypothetical protein